VTSAYSIYTQAPIKLWDENINAAGNSLANQIVGNRGVNRLSGGRGNDTLNGLTGDDTYVFARGDGRDMISDTDSARGNIDTLQFSDVRQTQLWFSRSGSDLQVRVLGGSDNVTIRNWYVPGTSGSDNQIERIRTADGMILYNTDVNRFVETMAAFAPPPVSQSAWRPGDSSNGKVLLTVNH
jgi:Ca2+-binding RTX toxin-like protein